MNTLQRVVALVAAVVVMQPIAAGADYEQALKHLQAQRFDAAATELSIIVEQRPDYADGHFLIGVCRYQQGRAEESVGHFSRAIELDGQKLSYRNALATAYLATQDARQALRALTGADALATSDEARFELHRTRGLALVQLARYVDAVRDLEAAVAFKSTPELELQLGVSLLAEGELGRAIEHLEQASGRASDDGLPALYLAEAHLERARSEASSSSDRKQATVYARQATKLRPDDERAWMRLGRSQMAAGDSAGAAGSFEVAVKLAPDLCAARINLGKCQLALGRFEHGAVTLTKARECAPTSASVVEALGFARLQLGQLEQAESLYEAAQRLEPSDRIRAGREIVKARIERRDSDAAQREADRLAEDEYRRKLLEFEEHERRRDGWRREDSGR